MGREIEVHDWVTGPGPTAGRGQNRDATTGSWALSTNHLPLFLFSVKLDLSKVNSSLKGHHHHLTIDELLKNWRETKYLSHFPQIILRFCPWPWIVINSELPNSEFGVCDILISRPRSGQVVSSLSHSLCWDVQIWSRLCAPSCETGSESTTIGG